jgi:isopentenyl diphosphate isomerase/L-lactate dehydrogenase-like FMN-dependent dehydrogenase
MPARRQFLRLLAGSPILACSGLTVAALETLVASGQLEDLIATPDQAINVMDFEPVARRKLPPAHFGYLATGVDDDATVRANREAFSKFQLRVRRLIDVSTIDMGVRLFGTAWNNPIVLAPVGHQKAFHPDGEMVVAKAARSKQHLQILSTLTTSSVEAVVAERGAPVWQQLYPTDDWNVTRAIVKRAEAAGCPVLVYTVDQQGGSNRETLARARRADARPCATCHTPGVPGQYKRHPMFDDLDLWKVTSSQRLDATWDSLKRLRDMMSMKLVIKGIVTREDAQLASEHGADGLIVSNHGGRGEESNRGTIECLPEVVEAVAGRIPVLVDGGFRRGTDIFKALALGANAICVGRPYLWGLAAFGQPGVETVLDILRRELQMVMRQAGTTSIDKITKAYVVNRSG